MPVQRVIWFYWERWSVANTFKGYHDNYPSYLVKLRIQGKLQVLFKLKVLDC